MLLCLLSSLSRRLIKERRLNSVCTFFTRPERKCTNVWRETFAFFLLMIFHSHRICDSFVSFCPFLLFSRGYDVQRKFYIDMQIISTAIYWIFFTLKTFEPRGNFSKTIELRLIFCNDYCYEFLEDFLWHSGLVLWYDTWNMQQWLRDPGLRLDRIICSFWSIGT